MKYFNPGLHVAGPEIIPELPHHPALAGKPDAREERLLQYKILETKELDRDRLHSSNEDFLRESQIQVAVERPGAEHLERIVELVERTNQLNFTKQRVSKEHLEAFIRDEDNEVGLVRVRDRYGDYGICGFYGVQEGKLAHLLFSCRIMGMGVERWLFQRLGRPQFEVAQPVAMADSELHSPVDWVQEVAPDKFAQGTTGRTTAKPKVLLKGGCDLAQIQDFLGRDDVFQLELNSVNDRGFSVHREHTEWLRQIRGATPRVSEGGAELLPFWDDVLFETDSFDEDYAAIVYSPLMDYTQGLYRERSTGAVVPYGDFLADITDLDVAIDATATGFDTESRERFSRKFEFVGSLTTEQFERNLTWLAEQLTGRHLIVLTGAEVTVAHPLEVARHVHHARMNAVVEQVAARNEHVHLCDVRDWVTQRGDVTNNLRHYRRRVYAKLADRLRQQLQDIVGVRFGALETLLRHSQVHVEKTLKGLLEKPFRALRGGP